MIDISTMAGLMHYESILAESTKEQLLTLPCPERISGKPCPQNLNDLTFEQIARLWGLNEQNGTTLPFEVIMGIDAKQCANMATIEAMGFLNMVYRELRKINEAFQACNSQPTQEEIAAGIDKLNFGAFGIADWYAKRMGMTNHDEAFATKWTRVYQCLKNDKEVEQFRRRYQDIINHKNHV